MQDVTKDRNLYVGGSDLPVIMEESYYDKTFKQLVFEKALNKPSEFEGNKYTEFGNLMEPQIRNCLNEKIENVTPFPNFYKEDVFIEHKRKIRGHVDGFNRNSILEIKTSSNPRKNIKYYNYQIQLYIYLATVKVGYLALYTRPPNFDPEFNPDFLEVIEVKRDDKLIEQILLKIEYFWEKVEEAKENYKLMGVEYITDNRLTEKQIQPIQKWEEQIKNFKEIEKNYKNEKEKLLKIMQEKDIKKFENDNIIITKKESSERSTFNKKLYEDESGKIPEKYYKTTKINESLLIKLKEKNERNKPNF